jgi:hypothetical protein
VIGLLDRGPLNQYFVFILQSFFVDITLYSFVLVILRVLTVLNTHPKDARGSGRLRGVPLVCTLPPFPPRMSRSLTIFYDREEASGASSLFD